MDVEYMDYPYTTEERVRTDDFYSFDSSHFRHDSACSYVSSSTVPRAFLQYASRNNLLSTFLHVFKANQITTESLNTLQYFNTVVILCIILP